MSKHHRHYKHLHIPETWEQYWSKYPNGYTMLESLIDWVSQVNKMISSFNNLSDEYTVLNRNMRALEKELRASWKGYKEHTEKTYEDFRDEILTIVNQWIATIEPTIQDVVVNSLSTWLDDGTLADIINEDVFNMKANQVDLENTNAQLAQKADESDLNIERQRLDGIELSAMNVRHVKEYGAKGDYVTDDTAAIQRALDDMGRFSALDFSGGTYLVSDTMYIEGSDKVLFGDKASYIRTRTDNFTMFQVNGYQVKFIDLIFWKEGADESPTYNPNVIAIDCVREDGKQYSHLGDMDHHFYGNIFYNFHTCIKLKGWNAWAKDNIFMVSRYGIYADYFEYDRMKVTRGFTFNDNRFHMMGVGNQTTNSQDSWCIVIDSPEGYNHQINDNMADTNTKNFYKGPSRSCMMSNNELSVLRGTGFHILDNTTANNRPGIISNNLISMAVIKEDEYDTSSHGDYGIYFEHKGTNVTITGNTIEHAGKDAIYVGNLSSSVIANNVISNPNANYFINGPNYNGIYIKTGTYSNIANNIIRVANGDDSIAYGINLDTGCYSMNLANNNFSYLGKDKHFRDATNQGNITQTFGSVYRGGEMVFHVNHGGSITTGITPNQPRYELGAINSAYINVNQLTLGKTGSAVDQPYTIKVDHNGDLVYYDEDLTKRKISFV